MKIDISLAREISFGDPLIRCTLDENVPFFDGASQDHISVNINVCPGFHELIITHYNKKDSDQILDSMGTICKDKHVEIKSISIDNIEFTLDELREGHFYPVYNKNYYKQCLEQGNELPLSLSPNLYLGHNGTWKLNFNYPFTEYIINKRKKLQLDLKDSIYQSDIEHLKKAKKWFMQIPDIIWKD